MRLRGRCRRVKPSSGGHADDSAAAAAAATTPRLSSFLLPQGLIRHFQPVIEERIARPELYDPAKYFQRSWTGRPFANAPWVASTEAALAKEAALLFKRSEAM